MALYPTSILFDELDPYLNVDVGHVVGRDEPADDDGVAERSPRVRDHLQPLVRPHLQV